MQTPSSPGLLHAANANTLGCFREQLNTNSCNFLAYWESQSKKRKLQPIETPALHNNIANQLDVQVQLQQDPATYPHRPSYSTAFEHYSGSTGYECLSERKTLYTSSRGGFGTTVDNLQRVLELNLLNPTTATALEPAGDLQSPTQNPDHNVGGDSSALTSEHLHNKMADHESFGSRSSKSDDEVCGAFATPGAEESAAGPSSSIMLFTTSASVSPRQGAGSPTADSSMAAAANKLPKMEENPAPPEEELLGIMCFRRSSEISDHVKTASEARTDQRLGIMDRPERRPGYRDELALAAAVTATTAASVLQHDDAGDWLQLGLGSCTSKPSSSAVEIHTLRDVILDQPSFEAGVNSEPRSLGQSKEQLPKSDSNHSEASAPRMAGLQTADFADVLLQQKSESMLKRSTASAELHETKEWNLPTESSRGHNSMQAQLRDYVHPASSSWEKTNRQELQTGGNILRHDEAAADDDQRVVTTVPTAAASRLPWSHEIPSRRTAAKSDTKPVKPERLLLDLRGVMVSSCDMAQDCAVASARGSDHGSVGRRLGEAGGPEADKDKVEGIFAGPTTIDRRLNQAAGSNDWLEADVHLAALKRAFPAPAFQSSTRPTQAGSTRPANVGSTLNAGVATVQQQLEAGSSSGTSHGTISLVHHDDAVQAGGSMTRKLFDCLPGSSSRSCRPPEIQQQLDLLLGMHAHVGQSAAAAAESGFPHASHGLGGGRSRNRLDSRTRESASPTGLWFKLQAAENQNCRSATPPPLHQVAKYYLRVKDVNVPVSVVKKYLVRKLGLADECEVTISCNGQPLNSCLPLHNVRELWQSTRAPLNLNTPVAAAGSAPNVAATTDHHPASIANLTGLIQQNVRTDHHHSSLNSPSTLLISPEDVTMVLVYSRAANHQ
ncbi:unnamed protein product [Sphagnum tenellum]